MKQFVKNVSIKSPVKLMLKTLDIIELILLSGDKKITGRSIATITISKIKREFLKGINLSQIIWRKRMCDGIKCKNCGQTWRNNEPTPFCQLGHKCTDGVACNCPTVEKCCSKCYEVVGRASREICGNILCPCHKKKEEECNDNYCKAYHNPTKCDCHKNDDSHFNRETPKEVTEEEVKLPKNIKIQPWNIYPEGSWQMNVSGLGQKLNEVIDYLRASKEKK